MRNSLRNFLRFAVVFLCLGATRIAYGIDIPAASHRQEDVNKAVASMMSGDRVLVPAFPPDGACWSQQSTWNLPVNGQVIFAGRDKSTIIDCYKPSADKFHTAGPLIAIYPTPVGRNRVSGFKLKGRASSSNYKYALVGIYGQNKEWRADNFDVDLTEAVYPDFNWAVPTGFEYWGHVTGVMDHWRLYLADRGALFIVSYNNYGGAGTEGDESWAAPAGFGGPDFLFAEDGEIHNAGNGGVVNDCYRGGKWVVRRVKLYGASFGQTHPTGGSHRGRGCRGWEAYDIEVFPGGNGKSNFNGFFLSSGSGVITNVLSHPGALSNFITLHNMRFDTKTYTQEAVPYGWGHYPSTYDLVDAPLDQPGMGQSDLLTGAFPNVRNAATGCTAIQPCVNPRQKREGVWLWNNIWHNPNMGGSEIAVYEPTMVEGRDYHRALMPGWSPFPYPHYLTLDNPGPPPATPQSLRLDSL